MKKYAMDDVRAEFNFENMVNGGSGTILGFEGKKGSELLVFGLVIFTVDPDYIFTLFHRTNVKSIMAKVRNFLIKAKTRPIFR